MEEKKRRIEVLDKPEKGLMLPVKAYLHVEDVNWVRLRLETYGFEAKNQATAPI